MITNTLLDGSGAAIDIGAYCSISSGVHRYTHDTIMGAFGGSGAEGSVAFYDLVYIGSQSVTGHHHRNYVVIAANSFVNDDVLGKQRLLAVRRPED